jgi:hypothetical protein
VKRTASLLSLLAVLSGLSGYLLSNASLAGKVGISLFYKQYRFLKTWWQGALIVFVVLLILFFVQGLAERKLSKARAKVLHVFMILLALAGLYFTYYDFRHTTSHRLLGERFHIGAYLFWIDWILISSFYLTQKKPEFIAP